MHWILPRDAAANQAFLEQLSLGGFDKALEWRTIFRT